MSETSHVVDIIVYVLSHSTQAPTTDEDRLIGVFSDHDTATNAIDLLRVKPGFRDWPQGFVLDEYKLGEDNWKEGFAWNDQTKSGELADWVLECFTVDPAPNVFVLLHRRFAGIHEIVSNIGFYPAHGEAVAAAHRLVNASGFRSFPQGFVVLGLHKNTIHWEEGFEAQEARLCRLLSCTPSSLPPDHRPA